MISYQTTHYSFSKMSFGNFSSQPFERFALKIRLKTDRPKEKEVCIYQVENFLEICLKKYRKEEILPESYELRENYFAFSRDKDEVLVLEARVYFSSQKYGQHRALQVGIPLDGFDLTKNRPLYLVYNGVYLQMIYNGEVINENASFGTLDQGERVTVDERYVAYFGFSNEVKNLVITKKNQKSDRSINYYSPQGYNVWAGDVINFWRDGTYHLLYLADRRHHRSRWGAGAHTIEHVTTKDFKHWTHHGTLVGINEQWLTAGTGTMFYHQNRYVFAYGLHTSRMIEEERLAGRLLVDGYERNGKTATLDFYDDIFQKGLYPNGSTWLESKDGIHFSPANQQFHWIENPSIYPDEKGALLMYGGYSGGEVWRADQIEGPWTVSEKQFPPVYDKSPLGNSSECPSVFTWNGYTYVIMGITGFWMTKPNADELIDCAALGYDVYDGLVVPMATAIGNGRYVLGGWISGIGWGSVVVHRELIQYADGRLGMKWLPELTPDKTQLPCVFRLDRPFHNNKKESPLKKFTSYYFEFTLSAKDAQTGKFAVAFLDEDTGKACELQLDFEREILQVNTLRQSETFAEALDPIHIAVPNTPQKTLAPPCLLPETLHKNSTDFALAHVDVAKGTFKLKLVAHYSPKIGGTILDAELAEQRTIISNRVDFYPTAIRLGRAGDAELLSFEGYIGEAETL